MSLCDEIRTTRCLRRTRVYVSLTNYGPFLAESQWTRTKRIVILRWLPEHLQALVS